MAVFLMLKFAMHDFYTILFEVVTACSSAQG